MTVLHLFTCQTFNTPSNLFTFHNLVSRFTEKIEVFYRKCTPVPPTSLQNKQTIATCLSIPFYLTFFLLKMSFPHICSLTHLLSSSGRLPPLQLPPISPKSSPCLMCEEGFLACQHGVMSPNINKQTKKTVLVYSSAPFYNKISPKNANYSLVQFASLSPQPRPVKLLFPHKPQVAVVIKNPSANSGGIRDTGLIPGLGRSPGGGYGNLLQYSCLENFHGQSSLVGYSP